MSRILITGGAGFIGTNLIIALQKFNHDIVSIDNYSIGVKENHQKGIKYIEGDVNDVDSLIKNNFDFCFHLAGLSRIQPSFKNPAITFDYNTRGVLKILEWSRKSNTKVIYSGSSSKHHNPQLSPYALCKFMGEEICKMYKNNYDLNIEIARFYNVYGPYEIKFGKWAAVIGLWRGLAEKGKEIPIIGDGKQKRDFTHVKDIVDGLIKIAFSNESHEDAWELGFGENFSLNDVHSFFKFKYKIKKVNLPDQKGNYRSTLRVNDDAIKKLMWEPKLKLKNYILNL